MRSLQLLLFVILFGCKQNFTLTTDDQCKPSTSTVRRFCNGATVADLQSIDPAVNWYTELAGGEPLTRTTALEQKTYFASSSSNVCMGSRTAFAVKISEPSLNIVNPKPIEAPVTADLTSGAITEGSTPGLIFTYFTNAEGTIALNNPSAVNIGTYYIKGTDATGCVSSVAQVTVRNATTTYVNNGWSHGVPDIDVNTVIDQNYTTSENIFTKSLKINTGKVFTVATGHSLTVASGITNDAGADGFVIENDAALFQESTSANTALATVIRNSSNLYRQDYATWSSPVSGQNLRSFSSQTLFNRFYSYDAASNSNLQEIFTVQDMDTKLFVSAKGYLIRMPNNWTEFANEGIAGTPYIGEFKGGVNNGDISIPLSNSGAKMNMVGNPYPSPISMRVFFDANPNILHTIQFWSKRNSAAGSGYITATRLGVTSVQPEVDRINSGDIIKSGQAFYLIANGANTLKFTNEMRVPAASDSNIEMHRFWLNLSKDGIVVEQMLVGYTSGATQGFDDGIDGKQVTDQPSSLTSMISGNRYSIQGRSLPFVDTDIVSLAFKSDVARDYTISLSHSDGLFAEGQDIFLKDNLTGVKHNLKNGNYTFSTEVGVFNTRFEIQY